MHDDNSHPDKAMVIVRIGQRHAAADAGISALNGHSLIYQRGPHLVRCSTLQGKTSQGVVTSTPGIVQLCQSYLERELSLAADWYKPKKDGNLRQIDPPHAVAAQILSMQGLWPFPLLTGVIGTPTMRPDGSLLLREGYDARTGYFLLSPPPMPPISDKPTKDQARKGLDLLKTLLAEFPFADKDAGERSPSRSVALSMLMTPVLRAAMTVAPCHAGSAPEPGTGKSYLADIAAVLATGDLCPVVSMTKGNAEECEKRLMGCALSGQPIIALDNMTLPLEGDFLCQLTERPRLLPRALGSSDMNIITNGFTVFANGQNLRVSEDMAARRTLMVRLDADVDDTTKREFTKPTPTQKIARNCGDYIAAVLTIARAYVVDGTPDLLSLPSYDDWCKFVRSPLVWLGEPDPVVTMNAIREADPIRTERLRVFTAWKAALNTMAETSKPDKADGKTVKELISKSNEDAHAELREAFLEIAASQRTPSDIDPRTLGNWLRKAKDTQIGNLKLVANKLANQAKPRWLLMERQKNTQA